MPGARGRGQGAGGWGRDWGLGAGGWGGCQVGFSDYTAGHKDRNLNFAGWGGAG